MKVNIGKREVVFVSIILTVFVFGVVVAQWSAQPVSHGADQMKVTIGGTDYSLQEAIDGGLIGGAGEKIDLGPVNMTYIPCEINITGMDHSGGDEKCGVKITYDGKSYTFQTPDHSEISFDLCWADLETQLKSFSNNVNRLGSEYVYLGREIGSTTAVGQTKKCVMGKVSV